MSIHRKIILVAIVIAGIGAMIIALFLLNQDFQEFVLSSISEEETVYAKGYSDKAWKEVIINDTTERVKKLLGEPLKIYKRADGSSSYYYTAQGPKDTNFKMRAIIFNKEGRVQKKVREFYVD